MAQFRFPLDSVLRWRTIELARENAKLQRLIQEKAQIDAMLNRLATERNTLTGSIGTLPELRGTDLRAMAAYGLRLRQHVEKLLDARRHTDHNLAAQQRLCTEAKLRVRLLEELRARRLTRWHYEEARQLETLAADSYLAGWNRDEA
jgi:flagellar export protein FliJ